MSETFNCDDKDQLVAYLYDELDGIVRRRVEDHLRACAACAAEVAGLSGVRRELAGWAPPEVVPGFALTQEARPAVSAPASPGPRWWPASVPVWAQAAAAVLVVAAGLSIANLQIRYGADGLTLTTGWLAPATVAGPAPEQAATAASRPADPPAWQPALAALESSLRQEIRDTRASAPPASSRRAELSAERVADLIDQSERRQKQELALRLAQFGRDLEVQRRSDLVRINQGFGQFEGRAGAEIARQRQMLDYIMRVSSQPPPQ
jgi:anti-sigma factor RsiW